MSFVPQQVNGTMVTNSSHLEVVKLIKCELESTDNERKYGGRWAGRTGRGGKQACGPGELFFVDK